MHDDDHAPPSRLPWHDAGLWQRLQRGEGCPLCAPPPPEEVVRELETCIVRAPLAACLRGYVCVIARRHVVELHDLTRLESIGFVHDLNRVSRAVQRLTDAVKINLLSLGNLVPHLHVHICPRHPGDRFEGRVVDPGDTRGAAYASGAHAEYLAALRAALCD